MRSHPAPGRIVSSLRGRWGWVEASMIDPSAEEIFHLRHSPPPIDINKGRAGIEWCLTRRTFASSDNPPCRDGSFHRQKDDGGGVNKLEVKASRPTEKISLQVLTPTLPHHPRNGTPPKGRWGVGLTIDGSMISPSSEETFALEITPPPPSSEEIFALEIPPPPSGRSNGTPVRGRWGSG
jgi:hypothetical protein